MTQYKIIVELDGENQVQVLMPLNETDFELIWQFTLQGDDEPIILKEFYSSTRFVIVNWNGWVRICDVSSQEIVVSENLGFSLNTHAVISTELNNLYIIGSKEQQTYFTAFNLDGKPEITAQVEINDDYYFRSLDLGKDGNLLMYFNDQDRTTEGKNFKHGFLEAYFNQSKITVHPLPYPQLNQFERKEPLIVADMNLGFLPLWHNVTVTKNEKGEDLYEFALMIFTLDAFEVVGKIPVRNFKKDELTDDEMDSEEMAEVFKAGMWNAEYIEHLSEFMENLNSMVHDSTTNTIWLCWRGGILVRLNLTDYSLSPLLVIASLPDSSIKGSFNFKNFYSELAEVHNKYLIIHEDRDYYKIPLDDINMASGNKIIQINPESYKMKILASPAQEEEKEYNSIHIIKVDDLSTAQSFQNALDQMILITKDIHANRKGDTLAFAVKDNTGVVMSDDVFFERAAKVENTLEKIAKIVRQFAAYPKSGQLYLDDEETALCYANMELAKADEKYLKEVYLYLAAIDDGHDVYNTEHLIPYLMERYQGTPQMKNIYKSLSEISEHWVEGMEV